ncbi:MAG: damage-inducible protein CinA [Spirochaetales bacterium]|nr:MAG: damage-inducible protein CinA [Spirochaetales bacterium]
MLAAAESCTGGAVGKAVTDIPGSSRVFWGGVVSYSNEAKTALLDVENSLIQKEGAVSGAVARAMAWGLRCRSGADWTVSVTGLAGPGGGSPLVPVGTVWIGWCGPSGVPEARKFSFEGGREDVRCAAVDAALAKVLEQILDK